LLFSVPAALGGIVFANQKNLQAVRIPPMVKFDFDFTPGGRSISWIFLSASGALVGFAAGIMGVGGGFLTFPIFVYVLGVFSMTTVGTDIFQIVFTAGYASTSQYAVFGFIDIQALKTRYPFEARQVLFGWWKTLGQLEKVLTNQKRFEAAKIVALANQKAVETAYNYLKFNSSV
jgi:uncharacterized membrane protein YfcA